MKNMIKFMFLLSIFLLFSCKDQNRNESIGNADLKLLRVYYAGEIILNRNNPNETETVTTKDIISNEHMLRISVEAKSETAKVYFDSDSISSVKKVYQSIPLNDKVSIKVEDGAGSSKVTKIYVINVVEGGNDKISGELKLLKASCGDDVIVHKTSVNDVEEVSTKGAISPQYKLKIEVAPRSKTAKIYFDDETVPRLNKIYDRTPNHNKVKIKVEDGEGASKIEKEYTLDIKEGANTLNAQLKMLKIFFDGTLVLNKENVDDVESLTIYENITNDNKLKVQVKLKSLTAKVFFDGDSSHALDKTYVASPNANKIIIKVEDEGNSPGSIPKQTKIYTVNVIEDVSSGIVPNDSIKCNVSSFVGGTNISGSTVDVFKAGKDVKITSGTTDVDGNVSFKLARGRYYDFVVNKAGFASSRVENVYVKNGTGVQLLPIVQRKGIVGKKSIAPRIVKIEHFVRATENSTKMLELEDVVNNYELNSSKENRSFGGFLVTVASDSGEIIPERIGTELNYGIGMNIGGKFSTQQYESHYFPIRISENGNTINRDPSTGSVTQKMAFDLTKVNFPSDDDGIIYIIAYDMAGNRCERHLNVKLTRDDEIEDDDSVLISAFKVVVERFTGELGTFGVNKHDGFATSYKTQIAFAFNKDNVKLSSVDIYRREYTGQTNINADWQRVDRRVFILPRLINKKGTFFNEADNSLTLEEGKIYQYKIFAYLDDGGKLKKVVSSVATTKVLPAFNVKLIFPSPNEEVELNTILQNGMKFKISNGECWKKENADYFVFGVLLLDVEHSGAEGDVSKDNIQKKGARFASRLRYNFNKTGNEVLEVGDVSNNWHTITGDSSDLFEYNAGEITLKKAFFENGANNLIEGKKLSEVLKVGEVYYWDVQDWGKNALLVKDDSPAYFMKEWKLKDSQTGDELQGQGKISFAVSAGNLLKGANALNGRALFTIK
ncbi:MAG: dentilisin complex subunit PrcA [Treponema sp.]